MPRNKRTDNVQLARERVLSFSQQKVVDALYEPITDEIRRARDNVNSYKTEYGEHKANHDLGSIFINDILSGGTWDKFNLPKHPRENYEVALRDVESSHSDAFADDFIRGRNVSNDEIDGFVADFINMYDAAATLNDGTLDRNLASNDEFFSNVKTKAQQYLAQNHVEEKLSEKKTENKQEREKVITAISKLKVEFVGRLEKKIALLEIMLNPDPSVESRRKKRKELVEAGAKKHQGLGKFFSDAFDVLFNDIGKSMKKAIGRPVTWVSCLAFLVDIFCFVNILYTQVSLLSLLVLFVGFASVVSIVLPYYLAKHISKGSTVRIVLDSLLCILVIAVSGLISYLYRNRFEDGNQLIMSLFVAFIPVLMGVVSAFTWHSRFERDEELDVDESEVEVLEIHEHESEESELKVGDSTVEELEKV